MSYQTQDAVSELVLDAQILQQFGPQVAVVQAVLLANDQGQGTRMTHKQVAKAAGISHITARRSIDMLVEAGLLKSEPQFYDNCQVANLYQFSTAARPAPCEQTPAHIEQPNVFTTTTDKDISLALKVKKEVVVLPGTTEVKDGLRPPGVATTPQVEIESHPDRTPPQPVWTPKGTPMPVISSQPGHKNVFELSQEASWLVMHFEGYVLDQMNQLLALKGKNPRASVGDDRRKRWRRSAINLLESRSLVQVSETIDWLFTHCSGYLPFEVANEYTGRCSAQDRKVTSIRLVLEHYERLMAEMVTPKEFQPLQPVAEASRPPTNYGAPLTDPKVESEVAELVSLFTDFRRACGEMEIAQRRTWAWAKSFRIMLARYSYPFEDIRRVVMALKECRHMVDAERYRDVYNLHCNSEWDQVLRIVELQEAAATRAQNVIRRENAVPRMTLAPIYDGSPVNAEMDDGIKPETEANAFGRSNMADNVAVRRARYAARVRQRAFVTATTAEWTDDAVDEPTIEGEME